MFVISLLPCVGYNISQLMCLRVTVAVAASLVTLRSFRFKTLSGAPAAIDRRVA